MKLIENWRQAWRFFSVQAQALALTVLGAWQVMPDDLRAALPPNVVYAVSMVLLVAGIVGRVVSQPKAE